MANTRTERDSLGTIEVPADALYGAQTQRAVENFPLSGQKMPESFIRALILIKKVAAQTNEALGGINKTHADAISSAECRPHVSFSC